MQLQRCFGLKGSIQFGAMQAKMQNGFSRLLILMLYLCHFRKFIKAEAVHVYVNIVCGKLFIYLASHAVDVKTA